MACHGSEHFDSFAQMMLAHHVSETYVSLKAVRWTCNRSTVSCFTQWRTAPSGFRPPSRPSIVPSRCASRREGARWGLTSRSATYATALDKAALSRPWSSFAVRMATGSNTAPGSEQAGCTASTYSTRSEHEAYGHTGTSICWSVSFGWNGGSADRSRSDCTTIRTSFLAKASRRPWSGRMAAAVHPGNRRRPAWAERVGVIAGAR